MFAVVSEYCNWELAAADELVLGLATVILTVTVFNHRLRVQSNLQINPIFAKLSNKVDN